jgi:hypothetical protein
MSIAELEEMTGIPDTLPVCPVALAQWMGLTPIPPQPVREGVRDDPGPRFWQYRVCGI